MKVEGISSREPEKARAASKPRWLEVLESAAVSSFITVVLGGIAGTVLVHQFQLGEQNQALEAAEAKERFEKRGQAVEAAYALLADGGYHARSLISLTEPPFQTTGRAADEIKKIEQEREAIAKAIGDFNRRWQKEKYTIGYLISYYHNDHPGVTAAWSNCVRSLDALRTSAHRIHHEYSATGKAKTVGMVPGEEDFFASIRDLATALEAARREARESR